MSNIFQWFVLDMFFILSLFMFSWSSIRDLKMTTKYQVSWDTMRNWLTGVSNNNYKAFCKVYRQEFSVKQRQRKSQAAWNKRQKAVNESQSQVTFGCCPDLSALTVSPCVTWFHCLSYGLMVGSSFLLVFQILSGFSLKLTIS